MSAFKIHKYKGEEYTSRQLSKKFKITQKNINQRLCKGMTLEQALTVEYYKPFYDKRKINDLEYISLKESFAWDNAEEGIEW